ncbi:MAG: hypothetical protein S4CHLAM7_12190 [Chlamydiae bacterium]|nr:hypothetical protein [Chlamydiota bacterium]
MIGRAIHKTFMELFTVISSPSAEKLVPDYIQKKVNKFALFAFSTLGFKASAFQIKILRTVFNELGSQIISYEKKEGGFSKYVNTPSKISDYFVDGNISKRKVIDNVESTINLLKEIAHFTKDTYLLQLRFAQVLTKSLITNLSSHLYTGYTIEVPTVSETGKVTSCLYQLDHKFNLWEGVSAFGFVDPNHKNPPLLLFKGTKTYLKNEEAIPSLIANLHPKAPAWKLYKNSKDQIENWLKEKTQDGTTKARVFGYSQGGAVASYLLTYQHKWISKKANEPSFIFDTPAIPENVAKDWRSVKDKPFVESYISDGDLVPKIGVDMIGPVFVIKPSKMLSIFDAHTALTLLDTHLEIQEMDIEKEMKSNLRMVVSNIQNGIGKITYAALKNLFLPVIKGV